MKKRFLSVIGIVVLILLAVSCAARTPSAGPVPVEKEQKVYNWKLQNIFVPGEVLFDTVEKVLIPAIKRATNGRVTITQYPAGQLVPSTEILKEVGKGTIQMAMMTAIYNASIMPEALLEFDIPGGPSDAFRYQVFVKRYWPLLNEAYNAHNVHQFRSPIGSNWYGSISKRPIRTIDDFKGLKIRSTGLFSEAYKAMGASPTFLPLEEIYTGLQLGTIDAFAYAGPYSWKVMKIFEVAKYITYPPEGGSYAGSIIINLDLWKSLPEDLQQILESVIGWYMFDACLENELANELALREAIEKYGCQLVEWTPETKAKWQEVCSKILDGVAAKNERCAKGVDILREIMDPKQHPLLHMRRP